MSRFIQTITMFDDAAVLICVWRKGFCTINVNVSFRQTCISDDLLSRCWRRWTDLCACNKKGKKFLLAMIQNVVNIGYFGTGMPSMHGQKLAILSYC